MFFNSTMVTKRVTYFDYLNVFSCISVIALHCNGVFHSYSQDSPWVFSVLIEVLFYCAVPVFFMLSGATLFDYRKRYTTTEFYKKRIKKTLVPYVFFTVIFFILDIVIGFLKNGEFRFDFLTLLQMLMAGTAPHADFWFFIPLFLLYLFIPFLSFIVTSIGKRELLSLLGIMAFFSGVYPIIAHFCGFQTTTTPISGFALYAFMGYCLHKYDFEKNNTILTLICILGLVTFITRFFLFLKFPNGRVELLMSYFGLYAIIPSSAIFMLFKRFLCNRGGYVQKLSALSFGIFLIQETVIQTLRIVLSKTGMGEFFIQTVGIVIVYTVCCCIVYLVRKINLLKWMFP